MYKFLFFVYLLCVNIAASAQSYFGSEYQSVWIRSGEYTLEVAEAMPEENYSFKPEGGSMTFQEQMIHISQNLSFLSAKITGVQTVSLTSNSDISLDKKAVIADLKKSVELVAQLIQKVDKATLQEKINFGGEEMSKENIFYLMRDHMAHHRGQAILHLRMNGINAPAYRGW